MAKKNPKSQWGSTLWLGQWQGVEDGILSFLPEATCDCECYGVAVGLAMAMITSYNELPAQARRTVVRTVVNDCLKNNMVFAEEDGIPFLVKDPGPDDKRLMASQMATYIKTPAKFTHLVFWATTFRSAAVRAELRAELNLDGLECGAACRQMELPADINNRIQGILERGIPIPPVPVPDDEIAEA